MCAILQLVSVTMADNTWKLELPLTAVQFSKQNSTFVAELNSNLQISVGLEFPPRLPLLRASHFISRIFVESKTEVIAT